MSADALDMQLPIDRERVEGCIQLSAHVVETFVAKAERPTITGKGQRRMGISRYAGSPEEGRSTRVRIDGVDVVAEIGRIERSASFAKSEGAGARPADTHPRWTDVFDIAGCSIDFYQIAGSRIEAEERTILPNQIGQSVWKGATADRMK